MEATEDELVDPDKGGVDLQVEAVDLNADGGTERFAAAMGWRGREVRRCDGEAERGADRVGRWQPNGWIGFGVCGTEG
jgi:hypothetical protein